MRKLKSVRGRFAIVLVTGLLVLAFQNCGPVGPGSDGASQPPNGSQTPEPSQLKRVDPELGDIQFPPLRVGLGKFATLTVWNDPGTTAGARDATDCQMTLTGGAEWEVINKTCEEVLPADEECKFVVRYGPKSVGNSAAQLKYQCQVGGEVTWNFAAEAADTLSSTGILITSSGPPNYWPYTTPFADFDLIPLGQSRTISLYIKNNSSVGGAAAIDCVPELNQLGAKFSILGTDCPASGDLDPQQACGFSIKYESDTNSIDSAKLEVKCQTGGQVSWELAGQTYLPCSMGAGTFGQCVLRNGNMPNYCGFDVGVSYVKFGIGPSNYGQAQSLCTNEIWDGLMKEWCPFFQSSAQWNVGLSNGDGSPNTSGCDETGCNYVGCP